MLYLVASCRASEVKVVKGHGYFGDFFMAYFQTAVQSGGCDLESHRQCGSMPTAQSLIDTEWY